MIQLLVCQNKILIFQIVINVLGTESLGICCEKNMPKIEIKAPVLLRCNINQMQ